MTVRCDGASSLAVGRRDAAADAPAAVTAAPRKAKEKTDKWHCYASFAPVPGETGAPVVVCGSLRY